VAVGPAPKDVAAFFTAPALLALGRQDETAIIPIENLWLAKGQTG
jgi:hypothetical protein